MLTQLTLPIALDAMGGDFAPSEIIAGARRAVDELGLSVILVGVPDLMGDPLGLEVVACTEVIAMDDDPAGSVRKKKDSSLVRAADPQSRSHADGARRRGGQRRVHARDADPVRPDGVAMQGRTTPGRRPMR